MDILPERERQLQDAYEIHLKRYKNSCPFCSLDIKANELIEETEYTYVVKNLFPYKNTTFHYVVIPKRHVEELSELDPDELLDLIELIALYNIPKSVTFTRGKGHTEKSVKHLHSHVLSYE